MIAVGIVAGIAAIAIGAAILAWVIWAALTGRLPTTGRRSETRGAGGPPVSEPPTFQVVALGLSGSGKTVMLSVLFHQLNYRVAGRPYRLQTPASHAARLADIYVKLIDTKQDWPGATHMGDKFVYVLDYVSDDDSTILRMNYLDYAGEILEPAQQNAAKLDELAADIGGAHALLGLIDGARVRQLLLGEPEGETYFNAVLLPMIGFVQRASCPVQLVVTKWDMIHNLEMSGAVDDQVRFDEVKRSLIAIPQIGALFAHRGGRRIRLIPLSALGPHFATLDDEGVPCKRSAGRLRPMNIDLPLCAVLPDLLRQVEQSLDEPLRRRIAAYMRTRMWDDASSLASMLIKSAGGRVLGGVNQGLVFLEWIANQRRRRGRARRRPAQQRDPALLRAELIKHMEQRVATLEHMWPGSSS